ncbi:MAG: serine hydrolase domain-containing protein [Rhodothermales bacterium]
MRIGFSVLLALAVIPNVVAQPSSTFTLPDVAQHQIDALFSEFDSLTSPGYAIGIAKGETVLYTHGYGSANLDYQLPITPSSAFSIASVSKQFTAACVALLILEGSLTLDDPAQTYIPELAKYEAYPRIRIKHLIYNTSGLTDYHRLPRRDGKSWITFNYFDVDESLSYALAEDTLLFAPGEQWDYVNVNFMLLAKIVEQVSGQRFATFARERLFEPLGMDDTLIHDDITAVVPNRVTPYNLRTPDNIEGYARYGVQVNAEGDYMQHHRNAPHYGGSGVVTTINDLMRWSINMVTHDFGGQAFFDLMHRTEAFQHDRTNQAFGLYWGDFNGRPIVAWDGGDWGISSQLMRFPDQGVAIAVLSNLGSGEAFRKVNAIADVLTEHGILE